MQAQQPSVQAHRIRQEIEYGARFSHVKCALQHACPRHVSDSPAIIHALHKLLKVATTPTLPPLDQVLQESVVTILDAATQWWYKASCVNRGTRMPPFPQDLINCVPQDRLMAIVPPDDVLLQHGFFSVPKNCVVATHTGWRVFRMTTDSLIHKLFVQSRQQQALMCKIQQAITHRTRRIIDLLQTSSKQMPLSYPIHQRCHDTAYLVGLLRVENCRATYNTLSFIQSKGFLRDASSTWPTKSHQRSPPALYSRTHAAALWTEACVVAGDMKERKKTSIKESITGIQSNSTNIRLSASTSILAGCSILSAFDALLILSQINHIDATLSAESDQVVDATNLQLHHLCARIDALYPYFGRRAVADVTHHMFGDERVRDVNERVRNAIPYTESTKNTINKMTNGNTDTILCIPQMQHAAFVHQCDLVHAIHEAGAHAALREDETLTMCDVLKHAFRWPSSVVAAFWTRGIQQHSTEHDVWDQLESQLKTMRDVAIPTVFATVAKFSGTSSRERMLLCQAQERMRHGRWTYERRVKTDTGRFKYALDVVDKYKGEDRGEERVRSKSTEN